MLHSLKTNSLLLWFGVASFLSARPIQVAPPHKGSPASNVHVVSIQETGTAGMCIGYCLYKFTIEGNKTTLGKHAFQEPEKYPDKSIQGKITDAEWNQLLQSFNLDAFLALPDYIGCPGCGDQVFETIAVTFSDGTQKSISYNERETPKELAMLEEKIAVLERPLAKKADDELQTPHKTPPAK